MTKLNGEKFRTFRSDNGVPFVFHRVADKWVYDLNRKKRFIITRSADGRINVIFSEVKGKGKYTDGTKWIDDRLVGIVFTMSDVCNGLETYIMHGAWWK